MYRFISILLLITLFGCGSIRVNYDYDKQAKFTEYSTFHFYSTEKNNLSDLDNRRIVRLMTEALEAKGLKKSENPDFLISIEANEFETVNRNNVGVAVGGTGRNVGGGVSVGLPLQGSRLSREIFIDFIDEDGRGTFWQAVATSSYDPNAKPNAREAALKAVVDKVLAGFPPQ